MLPFPLAQAAISQARPGASFTAGRRREGRAAGQCGYHRGRGAHITDLVLGLLDSLEFGRVCHHAEAFALVLLKLLLVAHLEDPAKREPRVKFGEAERVPAVPTSDAATSQERGPDQKCPCGDISHTPPLKAEDLTKNCYTKNDDPLIHIQYILSAQCFT